MEGVIGVFGGRTEPLVKGEGKDWVRSPTCPPEPKRCPSTACACPPTSRGPGTTPHASAGWVLSLLGVAWGSFRLHPPWGSSRWALGTSPELAWQVE